MKILFLDIDGVVNCSRSSFSTDGWPVDQYMAFLVGKIVLETDCRVVLSSSWRYHKEGIATVEKSIVPLFGKTKETEWLKDKDRSTTRGEEIKSFLVMQPSDTRYAILDDADDMLPEQQKNFFQTSWDTGLTQEIADKVIKHLNKK